MQRLLYEGKELKTCPHCKKDIRETAIRCKHCRRALSGNPKPFNLFANREAPFPPWGISDLILVVLLAYVMVVQLGRFAAPWIGIPDSVALGADPKLIEAALKSRYQVAHLLIHIAVETCMVGVIVLLIRFRYRMSAQEGLRLSLPDAYGMSLFVRLGLGLWLVSVLMAAVEGVFPGVSLQGGYFEPTAVFLYLAIAVTLGPVNEEIFWRGFLYPAIARYCGSALSVVIVSTLFALAHVPQRLGSPSAIAAAFVGALCFTVTRAITGSTLASIILHLSANIVVIGCGILLPLI